MVIVEGLDGCGKTTLITNLIKEGKQLVIPNNDFENFYYKYVDAFERSSVNSVMDRSFISVMVYGKVLSNKTRISEQDYLKLLKLYIKNKPTIIYLYAPQELLLERRKDDTNDRLILLHLYESLLEEFDYRLDQTSNFMPVYKINTANYNEQQTFEQAKKLIKL